MEKFNNRLNEGLRIRNISAAQLSRITKIDEATISNYRKGKYEPKQRKLEKIAKALHVSIPWLMGADVPISPDKAAVMAKMGLIPPEITKNVTEFPIIGEVSAGFENIAVEDWTGETIEIPNKYLKGYKKSITGKIKIKETIKTSEE